MGFLQLVVLGVITIQAVSYVKHNMYFMAFKDYLCGTASTKKPQLSGFSWVLLFN
jgi:hypothetical protein